MQIKNMILQKSDKYEVGGNKPYFTLSLPPAEEGGKWQVIGAFWLKEKNGKKYYSGSVDRNYTIEAEFIGELVNNDDVPFD